MKINIEDFYKEWLKANNLEENDQTLQQFGNVLDCMAIYSYASQIDCTQFEEILKTLEPVRSFYPDEKDKFNFYKDYIQIKQCNFNCYGFAVFNMLPHFDIHYNLDALQFPELPKNQSALFKHAIKPFTKDELETTFLNEMRDIYGYSALKVETYSSAPQDLNSWNIALYREKDTTGFHFIRQAHDGKWYERIGWDTHFRIYDNLPDIKSFELVGVYQITPQDEAGPLLQTMIDIYSNSIQKS